MPDVSKAEFDAFCADMDSLLGDEPIAPMSIAEVTSVETAACYVTEAALIDETGTEAERRMNEIIDRHLFSDAQLDEIYDLL